MAPAKKLIASREIWTKGFKTVAATRRQTGLILVFGLILPQLILSLLIDVESGTVVSELRAMFTSKAGLPGSFTDLISPAQGYMHRLAALIPLIFLLVLTSYFALVHIAVDHHRGEEPLKAGRAWLKGLRSALPGGLIFVIAIVLLSVIGQMLVAPAIIMGVLSLVVPVILVTERRGAFRSLWRALTLKYVSRAEYSGWTVLFNLMTVGALLYMVLVGTGYLSETLLFLDERLGVSRQLWTATLPGLPFGPVYLGVSILETTLMMGALALFPAMTAALYFTVVAKREISLV